MSASLASLLSRSLNGEPATSARRPLRRASRLLALEQRFMFDGAAVADAAHAAGDAAVLAQIAAVPSAVEVRAADPALDNGKKEAVLVDTSVADYKTLEAGIAAGLAIVEFDGSKDGLAQIARWAAGQSGYDAIHILSHGSEAALNLGTTVLTDSRLSDSLVQAELAELGHALKAGGDLLLYGCDLAAGSDGAKFLNDLSVATGADVAASTDATGSAAKNGDWVLEANSGSIDVNALAVADYHGLLATNITFTFESADLTINTTTATDVVSGETLQVTAPTQTFDTTMNIMGEAISGGESLFLNVDSQFTFSLVSGKGFDLTSIAIKNYEPGASITITIHTSKGDVTLTTLGNNSSGSNYQNFTLSDAKLTGITSFQLISSTAFYAGVDNVVLSNIATLPTTTVSTAALSADTGTSGDFITNTASQTITGTLSTNLASGEKVEVSYNGGSTWSDAISYTVGSSSWSTTTTLSGSSTFMARVTNSEGGSSAAFSHTYTLDTTAPGAPSAPVLTTASDSGSSNSDNITSVTTPTFTGTDTANSTITLYDTNGTTVLGTTTADGSGNWTITSSTLSEGSHTLTVKATDLAGNTSAASTSLGVTIDTTAPTVSGVTSSSSNASYKVGDAVSIQVTFSENVIVTGTPQLTLETGATDRVVNYASGSGSSTLTFTYTVQAGDTSADLDYLSTAALALNGGTIKDAAGNNATLTLASPGAANSLGANKAIVIDGVVPTVANVTSSSSDASYKVGDTVSVQVTFSETVTVTGTPQLTLETGATDRVVNYASGSGSNTLTFTYTVQAGDTSADLDYLSTSALALNGGTIKDAAGNNATLTLASPGASGSLGANKAIVVDTTAPSAPSTPDLATASDSGNSSTDNKTSATTPTFTGTAEANSTVKLYDTDGTTLLGTATADGSGNWSITAATLAEGSHTITAKATDAAGNTSSASTGLVVTIDTTAPTTPTVNSLSTASTTPTLTGTAATLGAGETLTVTVGGATYNVTPSGGNWSLDLSSATPASGTLSLSAGNTYSVTATASDAAGNSVSDASSNELSVLTGPPPTTTGSTVTLSLDSGSSNSDLITNVASQTISGTLSAVTITGETVEVSVDGGNTWSTATNAVGSDYFQISATLQGGTHALKVRVVNGNGGGTPYSRDYTLDTTAPTTTVASAALSADTGTGGDFITNTASQTISGTLSANIVSGETVYVSLNGGATWSTATTTVGQNDWTLSGVTLTGSNTLNVKVSDTAGNDGTTYSQAYTLDTAAPTNTIASVAFSADTGLNGGDLITQTAGQTISGTLANNLASGEVVRISLDNGNTWTVANATVGQNTWNLPGQTLSGSNTLKVKVSDLAGNDGTELSRAYSIDDTAPAIASATVNGASLVLTYDEALASGVTPQAGEYGAKVNGATVTVNAVAYDAAAKTVTLTLATAATATDTVTVTYTADGTAAHEVQDVAGKLAANLTDRAVTNNTASAQTQVPPPVVVSDPTPPAPPTPVPQPVTPSAPPVVVTPPSFNSTIVLSSNPVGDNSLTGIVNGGTPIDNGKTPIVDTTPTLTRGGNSGFQVAVRSGTSVGDALVVNQPIRTQTLAAAGRTEITVPADTFVHNNPNAVVRLSATQGNGTPLPPWVSFDAQKGKFVMQPPAGFKGDLVIKLTATDNAGRAVVTTFKVHADGALERPGAALPPGRPGLSEQLRVAAGQGDVLAGLRLALRDHADTLRG